MSYYQEVRKEIRERFADESLTRKKVVQLEQAIYKDLLQSEGKCRRCGRTENLTLEHIISKDVLKWFGINPEQEIIEENYAITCRLCNIFKGNRLDFSFPETKKVLMGLLEKL